MNCTVFHRGVSHSVRMMERAVVLVLCWMVILGLCTPLYPSLRFGQRATAILMSSSLEDPLQPPTDYRSAQSQHVEFRSGRHADAIFTNSYRKVLGQISARKFLQTITGKGSGTRPESEHYVKRQGGIFEDTYKQDLMSIEREHSYRKQQQSERQDFSLQCSGCACGVTMNRKCPGTRRRK